MGHDRIPKGQQWDDEGKVSNLGCCTGFLGECVKCCPPADDADAVALTDDEVAEEQQTSTTDSGDSTALPDWALALLIVLPITSCTMGGALVYYMFKDANEDKKGASLIMNQPTD